MLQYLKLTFINFQGLVQMFKYVHLCQIIEMWGGLKHGQMNVTGLLPVKLNWISPTLEKLKYRGSLARAKARAIVSTLLNTCKIIWFLLSSYLKNVRLHTVV